MYKYFFISVLLTCFDLPALDLNIVDSVSFYGMLRQHIALYDGILVFQVASPRLGLNIFRTWLSGWNAKVRLEYGDHLMQGISYNRDANSTRQLSAKPFASPEIFISRLTNVVLGNQIWGSIKIGKQWGSNYDIGSYMDRFNLYGGLANGIFSGRTNGGWSGTASADKASILAILTDRYKMMMRYQFLKEMNIKCGFNIELAKKCNQYWTGNFRLLHFIFDLNYFISDNTKIYTHDRINGSKFVNHQDAINVFVVGFE